MYRLTDSDSRTSGGRSNRFTDVAEEETELVGVREGGAGDGFRWREMIHWEPNLKLM